MSFWSSVKNKISSIASSITGESLDVNISNSFNPEGLGFTTRMDEVVSELAERQVDTMAIRHEGHEALRANDGVEGEKLLATARKMDSKGEKMFSDLRAQYGDAIVEDSLNRTDFENKVFSQLPDAVLKDNNEARPDAPEAQYNGGYEARKTGLLASLKSWKDRGVDAATAFFDKAAKMAETVRDGIEDGVVAGINGVANAGKAVGQGVKNGGIAIGQVGVIGAALAMNATDAAIDGINNNVVQPTKQLALKGVQNVQIGTQMAVNEFQQKREQLHQKAVQIQERAGAFVERKVDAANQWVDDRAADLEDLKNDAVAFKNDVKQGAKDTYRDIEARAREGAAQLKAAASKENIAAKLNSAAQNVDTAAQAKAGAFMEKAVASEHQVQTSNFTTLNSPTRTEMSMTGKLNEKAAYAVSQIGGKFAGMLSGISNSLTAEKSEVKNGIQVTGFNNMAGDAPPAPAPADKGVVEMTFTSDTSAPAGPPPKTPQGVGARLATATRSA